MSVVSMNQNFGSIDWEIYGLLNTIFKVIKLNMKMVGHNKVNS